jgi:hypothetical protein
MKFPYNEALIFLLLGNLNLFIVHRKQNDEKILETKFNFFCQKIISLFKQNIKRPHDPFEF